MFQFLPVTRAKRRESSLRRITTLAISVSVVLVAQAVFVVQRVHAKETPPPNVILIFTDDQGYEDLGCFGSPKIKTPHLDQMAREGMKFTDFYSANSVCSPSRAALLTGCYPTRVSIPGVLFPRHSIGLNPSETTIAELLRDQGYATACIGKWHLGHKAPFLPTQQGFDSYFGIPYSNDMTIDPAAKLADKITLREGVTREQILSARPKKNWVPLMRNEEVVEYPCDQTTLTKRYTESALEFIRQSHKQPFFLYLPQTMPHIPLFASKDFAGKSERGLYGDTIEEIDWSVGQILGELKKLEIDQNTLVIYTSDNGPWKLSGGRGGSAYPLRGYKFQTYEGGMRVPCLMRWPGKIPAGTVCGEVAATIDLLPTIAAFTGASIPTDRVIDGHNIRDLMFAKEGATTPHDAYYYYRGNKLEAIRQGNWKLRQANARPRGKKAKANQKGSNQKGSKKQAGPQIELFDLSKDIRETKNVASENPKVVASLLAEIKKFDAELQRTKRPAGDVESK